MEAAAAAPLEEAAAASSLLVGSVGGVELSVAGEVFSEEAGADVSLALALVSDEGAAATCRGKKEMGQF